MLDSMVQRTSRSALALAAVLGLTPSACAEDEPHARSAPAASSPQSLSVEDEVLANVRNQRVGSHTVADFNLPEEFLCRIADRIIRASFYERHRIVVGEQQPPARRAPERAGTPATRGGEQDPRQAAIAVEIIDRTPHPAELLRRKRMDEGKPPLRGFRPAILPDEEPWPLNEPNDGPALQAAAALVGKRLASDGLLPTTARAIEVLGPEPFVDDADSAMQALKQAGLPVDWLRFFSDPASPEGGPVLQQMARRIERGEPHASLNRWLASLQFSFEPTNPRFRASTESGEHEVGLLRAQLSRGDSWLAQDDGGNIDLLLQATQALNGVHVLASIERRHLADFDKTILKSDLQRPVAMRIVIEDLPVSQWAQDNGKAGVLVDDRGVSLSLATLVPRYGSRGDDGSNFIPGETFLHEGLAAAGHAVIHSPLLFQGGNLLVVQHPETGRRILLLADAELHRNTALGLSPAQVREAFTKEFAVDECAVLPLVSFHLDYDLTVRAVGAELVAFVNDPIAAMSVVLESGLPALLNAGVIDRGVADQAREHLRAGQFREFMNLVAGRVYSLGGAAGHFPLALAECFSTAPGDSGVGNLQCFLQALDLATALTLRPDELPADRHAASYLRSLQRMEQQRHNLHKQLAQLGLRVAPVPGLPDAERGITYVNGIQARGVYLMPAHAGLYARLDDVAERTFAAQFGPEIRIARIRSSESQRRSGAVHCSLSAYPHLAAVRPK